MLAVGHCDERAGKIMPSVQDIGKDRGGSINQSRDPECVQIPGGCVLVTISPGTRSLVVLRDVVYRVQLGDASLRISQAHAYARRDRAAVARSLRQNSAADERRALRPQQRQSHSEIIRHSTRRWAKHWEVGVPALYVSCRDTDPVLRRYSRRREPPFSHVSGDDDMADSIHSNTTDGTPRAVAWGSRRRIDGDG